MLLENGFYQKIHSFRSFVILPPLLDDSCERLTRAFEVPTAALLEAVDDATAAPLHDADVLVSNRVVLPVHRGATFETAVAGLECPQLLTQASVAQVHLHIVEAQILLRVFLNDEAEVLDLAFDWRGPLDCIQVLFKLGLRLLVSILLSLES